MDHSNKFYSLRRLRCVLKIFILIGCIPLSAIYIATLTLLSFITPLPNKRRHPITKKSKVVLVTGGKMSKSLHFARWFWKNGYKVVMVETEKYRFTGSRWSRAVTYFETVACPRIDSDKYVNDLVKIAEKYKVDYFIPISSPVSSIPDSKAKIKLTKLGCRVFHFNLDMTEILDDKHKFCKFAKTLGLSTPDTFCVTTEDEVRKLNHDLKNENVSNHKEMVYILKNLEYDPKHRLDLFKIPCQPQDLDAYLSQIRLDGNPIHPGAPWQVQQFIEGSEYACMVVVREGNIRAITTSESSPSQLNYKHIDIPDITLWVEQFCMKTKITGQLCFDFLVDNASAVVYPIECNPRVHSQCVTFLGLPEFGEAVLSDNWSHGTLKPPSNAKPVFWFYNELFKSFPISIFNYRKKNDESGVLRFFNLLLTGVESDLDIKDPLPFIMRNHFQLPMLLFHTLKEKKPWLKLDFCIGKVVELNGD